MKSTSLSTFDLPEGALPFVRELLLELTRRLPTALGRPPSFGAEGLADADACREAADTLLAWFDGMSESVGRHIAEFEGAFGSVHEGLSSLDGRIHRAVLQARHWLEEEMTFSRVLGEVLEELVHPDRDGDREEALRQLLRRIVAKEKADRAEAEIVSRRFGTAKLDLDRLKAQVAGIERRTRELHGESLRDGLTGLWNRRACEQRLGEEVSRAQRYGPALSIVLWDVDRLKRINETHGHRAGDQVLQALAGRVSGLLRRSDFLARHGGEEFVAVLPSTSAAQALVVAEKIRDAAAAGPVSVTISAGIAAIAPADTAEALLERAAAALRRAQGAGGDRVEIEDAPPAVRSSPRLAATP